MESDWDNELLTSRLHCCGLLSTTVKKKWVYIEGASIESCLLFILPQIWVHVY